MDCMTPSLDALHLLKGTFLRMDYIEVDPRIKGNTTEIKLQGSWLTDEYRENYIMVSSKLKKTHPPNVHSSYLSVFLRSDLSDKILLVSGVNNTIYATTVYFTEVLYK